MMLSLKYPLSHMIIIMCQFVGGEQGIFQIKIKGFRNETKIESERDTNSYSMQSEFGNSTLVTSISVTKI